jgi:hypothetical protein
VSRRDLVRLLDALARAVRPGSVEATRLHGSVAADAKWLLGSEGARDAAVGSAIRPAPNQVMR